jgi:hypothetical protein
MLNNADVLAAVRDALEQSVNSYPINARSEDPRWCRHPVNDRESGARASTRHGGALPTPDSMPGDRHELPPVRAGDVRFKMLSRAL